MKELTVEQRYIQHVLDNMKNRVAFLKQLQAEDKEPPKDEDMKIYVDGFRAGQMMSWELEIEYLEREINFLSGAIQ